MGTKPAAASAVLLCSVWLSVLGVCGCARGAGLPPWRYPGYDANRTHTVDAAWPDNPRIQLLARFAAPGAKRAAPAEQRAAPVLLYGDVAGRGNQIVLADANEVSVYSERGRRIVRVVLDRTALVPGFLDHFPGQRKLSLFIGAAGAGPPELTVVDGVGNVVARRPVPDPRADYRVLVPVFSTGDAVYAVARENWPTSPRGLLRLALRPAAAPSGGRGPAPAEDWFFAVPFDPIGASVDRDGITLWPRSRYTSAYMQLGTEAREVDRGDASLFLAHIGFDGRLLAWRPVHLQGSPLAGTGRFLVSACGSLRLLLQDFAEHAFVPESENRAMLHVLPDLLPGSRSTAAQEPSAPPDPDMNPDVNPGMDLDMKPGMDPDQSPLEPGPGIEFAAGTLRDVRFVPASNGLPLVAVAVGPGTVAHAPHAAGGPAAGRRAAAVRLYSVQPQTPNSEGPRLTLVGERRFATASVRGLGAVVRPSPGEGYGRFFLLTDSEVLLLDAELRTVFALPADRPERMVLSLGEGRGRLILAGRSVDVHELRW